MSLNMNLAHLTRSLFTRKPGVQKPLARRCRPQLEGLTDRVTPAVTASVVGGVLTIKATGADADDALYLSPIPQFDDRVKVRSTNGGIVNGTPDGSFDAIGVNSIQCDLGEGNDTLDMSGVNVPRNISFRGGNGANSFYYNNATVGGSISVTNRTNFTGKDLVHIRSATINGNVTVNNGLGSTKGLFSDLDVKGSLKYTSTSSALIPGDDVIVAGLLHVEGNITLALANGTNTFLGGEDGSQGTSVFGPMDTGGSFTYTGGTGLDNVLFNFGATIGTAATITLGQNLNTMKVTGNNGLSVGTKLTVTAGTGNDSIDLISTAQSRVTGAASFKLGDGNNAFTTSSLRAGLLGLTTGAGNDTGTFDNLIVDGAATLKFGAGTNTVKLASTSSGSVASTIGGALTVTTGAGADAIQVGTDEAFSVGGAATFTLGTTARDNGSDGLAINNATFASTLNIISGAGNDALYIADLYAVSIIGKLTVNAGAGNDQLVLGMFNDPSKVVRLTVVPNLIGGAGGDVLKIFPQTGGGNVQGPPGVTVLPAPDALVAAGWEGLV
jgi:hypothetical protein